MKIKYLLFSFLLLVGFSSVFVVQDVSADSGVKDSSEFFSQVKIFDENDNEIPYTNEELEQLIQFDADFDFTSPDGLISTYASKTFNYGPMTFSSNFWVGPGWNGRAFKNPRDITVSAKGTAKKLTITAYNDNGVGAGTKARSMVLPAGWIGSVHIPSWSSLPRGKSYRFYFETPGSKWTINNVAVLYD